MTKKNKFQFFIFNFLVFLSIFLFIVNNSSLANPSNTTPSQRETLITDPSLSNRCKAMLSKKDDLLEVKQKLMALRKRNEKILNSTPEEKITLKEKTLMTQKQILREIELNKIKIENLDEQIIKTGCPSVGQ